MVRKYIRKKEKGYTIETLLKAVEAVRSKQMNSYRASEWFGVPRSTIEARATGARGAIMPAPGKPTVFSKLQEEHIALLLHVMEKAGYPLTRKEVKTKIAEYVRRNGMTTPFKNETPGDDWCNGFMKRNNLSMKKPQSVEVARKNACNPFTVYHYFDLLENAVQELGLTDKPHLIYNLDETSFCNDPSSSKIIGRKGYTSTRTTSGPGRDNTTVLLAANAQGEKVPPLIVFQGKHLWNEWFYKNDTVKTAYSVSKNGWMETSLFEKYFKDVFLPALGSERPVLLVYDGHKTHVDLNIVELAVENNITILKLPPHSSHVLQPLDCSTMKSMKVHWEDALVKWQRLHTGAKLPKSEFARLLTEIWDYLNPVIIQNGFRRTGLCPVDRNAISKEKFDIVSWAKWEKHQLSETRDTEQVCPTKELQNQEPSKNIQHTDALFSEHSKEVPSLLTLVLNHINGHDHNSNIITKTNITHSFTVNPKRFILNPPNKTQVLKERTSNLIILDTKIIKKGAEHASQKEIHKNVSFEEILLETIKKNDLPKNPRKRVQKGAEILTYKEVIESMKKEKEQKEVEIKRKEVLKNLKTEKKRKIQRKRKSAQKNKNIKKKKRMLHDKSDSEDTDFYSLRDSSEDEDALIFYQSLLDSEKEEENITKELDSTVNIRSKKKEEKKETHEKEKNRRKAITKIQSDERNKIQKYEENSKCMTKQISKKKNSVLHSYSLKDPSEDEDGIYFHQSLLDTENEENHLTKELDFENNRKKANKKTKEGIKIHKHKKKSNFITNQTSNNNIDTSLDASLEKGPIPSTSKEELNFVQTPKKGDFLLVNFSSARGKKTYKYVCIVEEVSDEKVVVKGCKSYKKNKKAFRLIENDISIIDLTQIDMYLPAPEFDKSDNVFIFRSEVAVVELM